MEHVYAFTDESGAFGWDLSNPTVSTHFIISSIIVREPDLPFLREEVTKVQQHFFPNGELKSSKIGKNHIQRKKILAALLNLPFSVFAVVVDKKQLSEVKGLRFKPSFYKFLNNIVHTELRSAYTHLTIVADEIGGSDYMQSFSSYVESKQDFPNMFGDAEFRFQNSQNDVLIQLADLLSGTLSFQYDAHKYQKDAPNYLKLLEKKIIRVELYPKTYETYMLDTSALAGEYDHDIAEICLHCAVDFINKYAEDEEPLKKAQLIIIKYLLFRFINNNQRNYISTRELKSQLIGTYFNDISTQTFRTKIIGGMRDKGVIISGSSAKKGYKVPANKSELYDFINHGTSIIMPMLNRLKTCRDIIKLGTTNQIDLFDNSEYKALKRYFDD